MKKKITRPSFRMENEPRTLTSKILWGSMRTTSGKELEERVLKSNESVNLIMQFAALLSWVKENEK